MTNEEKQRATQEAEIIQLKAQVEQLSRERQALLAAVIEIVQATESYTNHVTRVFQSLGIKQNAQPSI